MPTSSEPINPGSLRDCDGVKLIIGQIRFLQRPIDDRADDLDVGARCQFREDAAVLRVQVDL